MSAINGNSKYFLKLCSSVWVKIVNLCFMYEANYYTCTGFIYRVYVQLNIRLFIQINCVKQLLELICTTRFALVL